MTSSELETTLRAMVRRFGYERVARSLREVKPTKRRARVESSKRGDRVTDGERKRSSRTALRYVSRLDPSKGSGESLVEAARRFDAKAFLPSIGDIRNFCAIYRIEEPASRAGSIPRVFQFIAAMRADERRELLDSGRFSGPARLGPLSDAIQEAARERRLEAAHEGSSGIVRAGDEPLPADARSTRGARE